jgi:lipopolysaccharide/colanic/teichoic acid biosynthesis glycosyltransferase
LLDLSFIVLLSPAWLLVGGVVAIIVKAGSPGPVLFRQRRVGYRGKEFTCLKFRTMYTDADTEHHRRHTEHLIKSKVKQEKLDSRKDPRVVPLGSLLRAGGLDELPQLINIFRGEMSLVGPRPCIPYEYKLYEPWHCRRLDAVPGLTGLWQVSGKNHTTFDEMVLLDIEYAQRQSLPLDLAIMLRTFPALWTQYRELRGGRRRENRLETRELGNSVQSYRL